MKDKTENLQAAKINWFPGHMTKARRMIAENVKIVDTVCEIIDARIPLSSRNPDLDELTGSKPRLVIMNKVDMADPERTRKWAEWFKAQGKFVLETDCKSGKGTAAFTSAVRSMLREKLEQYAAKGQTGRQLRVMVVGIPNVGKSTFINKIAKRRAAEISDRPGVTRGKQWINIDKGLELLDTPGILWPKFDSQEVGEHLAYTGAIRDQVVDIEALAASLLALLRDFYPDRIETRYKFAPPADASGYELLSLAGKKRGFLISGGEIDTERMANILLDEFRAGKLGRITLELPPED
ncbi:MAG: ribosome biogenesis GTPase YlqF [Oscillospiraceae bacterium]|nr:ribosome biogenesis GTPase YlqF [Oscillospiraceae bacterium]